MLAALGCGGASRPFVGPSPSFPEQYAYPTYRAVSDDGDELYLKVKRKGNVIGGLYFFVTKSGDGPTTPTSGNVVGTVQGNEITADLRDPYNPEESIVDAKGEFRPNGDIFFRVPDDPNTAEDEAEDVLFKPYEEPRRAAPKSLGYVIRFPLNYRNSNSLIDAQVNGDGWPVLNGGGAVAFTDRQDYNREYTLSGWTFLLGPWRCVHVHLTKLGRGNQYFFDHVATYWMKADYTGVQEKYLDKPQPLHKDSAYFRKGVWQSFPSWPDSDGFLTEDRWSFEAAPR